MDDYMKNLRTLRDSLVDSSIIQTTVLVHRVLEDLADHGEILEDIRKSLHLLYIVYYPTENVFPVLNDLLYARSAEPDLRNACLAGTREEMLDTVLGWTIGASPISTIVRPEGTDIHYSESSRVLWICGVSGSGKSTIAHSVASRLKDMDRLGSFYAFDYRSSASSELNPNTLFSTIARDLADRDVERKRRLVESIRHKKALRTSSNTSTQFSEFIVKPASELGAIGDTIVVIDAFDESASVADRAQLLEILTSRATDIPVGLKFVVTSRFELDVQKNMRIGHLPKGVDMFLLDSIPDDSTSHDIKMFVYHTLSDVEEVKSCAVELNQLVEKSQQSFQWASTACRFIRAVDDGDGGDPRDRLKRVIEATAGGLDELYEFILDRNFGKSQPSALSRLKSMLGLMACAAEPLPLRLLVMLSLSNSDPTEDGLKDDLNNFRHTARLLASLLSGVHELDTPVKALHASFTDFLRDSKRSGKYSIDWDRWTRQITHRCLEIMVCGGLKFNICEFPSSFMRNNEVEKLDEIICDSISLGLSYACRYWPRHVAELNYYESSEVDPLLLSLLRHHFLSWLEVMSLLKSNPQTALRSQVSLSFH